MSTVIVAGSGALIGSQAAAQFARAGCVVVGFGSDLAAAGPG